MAIKNNGNRMEIRLAGEGGQGMILAGIILAEAAAIYDNKNATQTQSYGPEARGGASKAEVVIAQGEIDHPEVIIADVLVAMSQEACDKYAGNLKKDGLLIVDQERVGRVPSSRAIKVPITRLAQESSGKSITANVVALGVLVGLTECRFTAGDHPGSSGAGTERHRRDEQVSVIGRFCRSRPGG